MAAYRMLLAAAAVNGSIFGSLFILVPDFAIGLFGSRLDAFSSLIVRQFGGVVLGIAIFDWMLRSTETEAVRRAVVTANVAAFTIVAVVAAYGAASGIANPLAWIVAVFHGGVAAGLLAVRRATPSLREDVIGSA